MSKYTFRLEEQRPNDTELAVHHNHHTFAPREQLSWFDLLHPERHKGSASNYIKSIIYGGLDGIVSVFVSVAAVSGGSYAVGLVLVLGLAKLIAGGVSMGVGDWLATDAEVDLAKRERQREEWEVDNYPEGEIEEMVQLYMKKGVSEEAAREIMQILVKHKKAFVDVMMAEELGIASDADQEVPWKHGVVNFTSFMVFGIVPLIAYIIILSLKPVVDFTSAVFYVSIIVTALTAFGLGVLKGKLTGSSIWKSGIITVIFGAFTATIGWFVGWLLDDLFPGVKVD